MTRYTNIGFKRTYVQAGFDEPIKQPKSPEVPILENVKPDDAAAAAAEPAKKKRKRNRKKKQTTDAGGENAAILAGETLAQPPKPKIMAKIKQTKGKLIGDTP